MLFGVDIASVDDNKKTNWALAKAQGPISFAIIRATYSTTRDPQFAATWPQLQTTRIVRGAYMFLVYPRTGQPKPASPTAQATALIDTVGDLERTDLPPSLDIEFPKGRSATGMSATAALDWAREAWTTLKDHYGVPPIVYTSGRVWREDLADLAAPDLVESPLWLARYFLKTGIKANRDPGQFADGKRDPPVPTPWGGAWAIHQYQGDAFGFPGFSSTVDINRFNTMVKGSSGDLVRWVQRKLGVTESGTYDDATWKALLTFQAANDQVVDGIVGPKTFASLCWATPPS